MSAVAAVPAQAGPVGDATTCIEDDGAQAMAACDRAIAGDRDNGPILALLYVSRAVGHYRNNDNDAAIADADAAIRLDPASDAAYGIRGLSHHDRGDYDLAIADFETGMRLDPSDPMFAEQRRKSQLAKSASASRPVASERAAQPHETAIQKR